MILSLALASVTLVADLNYPEGFEEFATEILEQVEAHPDGQEMLHYAACALWFHRSEQPIPRGRVFLNVQEMWDVEVPQSLVRWTERVPPDRAMRLASRFLDQHHDRLSDRMCYAIVVGFMVENRPLEDNAPE